MSIDSQTCPLCNPKSEDILFDTHNFYLAASKSTLDILIIPKNHYPSMADLPGEISQEFDELRRLVRKLLSVDFGECVFYEHAGEHHTETFVGHGDGHGHAHFHCSQKGHELLEMIPDVHIREVASWMDHIASRRNGEQYLYIEDNGDKKYVILIDEVRHLLDKGISI